MDKNRRQSLIQRRNFPETTQPYLYRRANTMGSKFKAEQSHNSSKHSIDSSSSSSNNLSDEEIRFNQIDLHPLERQRRVKINPEAKIHKFLHGKHEALISLDASHFEDNENWLTDTVAMLPNMKFLVRAESTTLGQIKMYDQNTGDFYSTTREDAIEKYAKGGEYIIECSNYTRQDVIFFSTSLGINAVLCWELLTKYTPDKYQKFGSNAVLYAISQTNTIDGLKAKDIPLKLICVPRLLIIFTPCALKLNEIIPQGINLITGDIMIYLILHHTITKTEEVVKELQLLTQEVYSESTNSESLKKRYFFKKVNAEKE